MPVPLCVSLVVKKGSKMRLRVAASIPVPVSDTLSRVKSPDRASGFFSVSAMVTLAAEVVMVMRPPRGMASRALSVRFMITCSSPV